MKTYLVAFIFLSSITASAASRCASVLRSFTAEQVELTLENLAQMTLDADIAKSSGTSNKILNKDLKTKSFELMETLGLSQKELREQLAPRISRLQEKTLEQNKEKQRHREATQNIAKYPQWTVKETVPTANISEGIVGVTDVVNGHRGIIYKWNDGFDKEGLRLFSPTGRDQDSLISANVQTMDPTRNLLLVFFEGKDFTQNSTPNLIFWNPRSWKLENIIQLDWPKDILELVYNNPRSLDLAPDGNSFAIRSNEGVFVGKLDNPKELFYIKSFNISAVHFLNAYEFIAVDRLNNNATKYDTRSIATKTVSKTLWGRDTVTKILKVDENKVALMSKDGISYIDTKTMNALKRIDHPMHDAFVPVPGFNQPFYIGIENAQPVVKNLNNFTKESLSHLDWPTDAKAYEVGISQDGKAVVVFGSQNGNKIVRMYE